MSNENSSKNPKDNDKDKNDPYNFFKFSPESGSSGPGNGFRT